MQDGAVALVARGRRALEGCDWAAAGAAFTDALALEESAEGLDGLGTALYWQGDYARSLPLLERAYRAYRQRGGAEDAAAVALRLAQLHGLIHGNGTAVSGWVGHAQRLLGDCGDCPEQGALQLFLSVMTSDPADRERLARAAAECGRRFGALGLQYDALGYVGKARIECGAVAEGLALIDEAVAAAAGGLLDPWSAGSIWCSLFHACEMAIDVVRADQWLDAVDRYVTRTDELPISAICRMHYGGLLTAVGRWDDADRELSTALDIYRRTYRGTRFEALLRLADLRARQGRVEEAARLIDGHEDLPPAAVPHARLLLRRGESERAHAVLRRHLPSGTCWLPTAPALALGVETALACGIVDEAGGCAAELARLADVSGLSALQALAARARAAVAAATGDADAVAHLDAAIVHCADAALAHDLACSRLDLARVLAATRPAVARGEARAALDGFRRIGAGADADAAAELLRQLGEPTTARGRAQGTLTPRQQEVLTLLTEGLSNADIAARLFISPRTVEHHVSAVLSALGCRTRAEAVATALRRDVAD